MVERRERHLTGCGEKVCYGRWSLSLYLCVGSCKWTRCHQSWLTPVSPQSLLWCHHTVTQSLMPAARVRVMGLTFSVLPGTVKQVDVFCFLNEWSGGSLPGPKHCWFTNWPTLAILLILNPIVPVKRCIVWLYNANQRRIFWKYFTSFHRGWNITFVCFFTQQHNRTSFLCTLWWRWKARSSAVFKQQALLMMHAHFELRPH